MPLSSGLFTTIGGNASARAAAQQDSVVFLETSFNGPIGATGLHFNSINLGLPNDPLGVKIIANARKIFNTSAARTKVFSELDFDGVVNPNELVYIMSALRGRVAATNPTHTGYFVLQIVAAGNFQITNGTLTTANIASTATQAEIEAALILTFGRGFGEVVMESSAPNVFAIELWGEYAVGAAITLVAAGVATLTPTVNPSTLGVYRHSFPLNAVDLAAVQTFRLYQGPFDQAGASKRYNASFVSSLGMTIGIDDCTLKGKMFCHPGILNQTIVSSLVTDIGVVVASAPEWDIYLGTDKSGVNGPSRLCNLEMISFDLGGLTVPYMVLGCNTTSYKGIVVGKSNSSIEIKLAQDTDSDALNGIAQSVPIFYAVLEWKKGADIVPGVPYRILVTLPFIMTEFSNSTEGALSIYDIKGEVSSTSTLIPKVVIDCGIPTVVA